MRLVVDDGHGHTDDDTATVTIQPAAPPTERPYTAYLGIGLIIIVIVGLLAYLVI